MFFIAAIHQTDIKGEKGDKGFSGSTGMEGEKVKS